jgi:3-dehydroquinate synthase
MVNEYFINKQSHYITFCKKKNIDSIAKSIEKINSDKNVLFIYDDKVDGSIIKNISDELNIFGCKLIKIKCKGKKINKNEKFLFKIIDTLLKEKFTKRSIVISCGGGVVSDVAALASSLYLRGLFYFNIPSTMTAIVDSCIGGKTAINYKGIINSIGTYFHPKNVFILEDIIVKLPDREFNSGLAEIIKCGLIDKSNILSFLKKNKNQILERNFKFVEQLCLLTLKIKIKFFTNDVYEENQRLYLNFGHTFAHAIEMALENNSNNEIIRHGEAVSLGILCEIYYANRGKNNLYKYTEKLLDEFKLPTKINFCDKNINKVKLQKNIYKFVFMDKKKISQYPRYISLKKIGLPKTTTIKDFDFLNDTILNLFNYDN